MAWHMGVGFLEVLYLNFKSIIIDMNTLDITNGLFHKQHNLRRETINHKHFPSTMLLQHVDALSSISPKACTLPRSLICTSKGIEP
jgi:hypothetical protein